MVKCVSAGQVVACLCTCFFCVVSECVWGLMSVLAIVDLYHREGKEEGVGR